MSKLSSKLAPLFEEVRRRRLFRVVILYVLVGLAALEGAGNLGSALNFPGWTNTLVALVVLAGFPIAILVGWFFDFTTSGFVRTGPAATAVPAPIRTGGAAQAVGYAAVREPTDRKSIAVLPFVDMSPDGSQEYFGDGIAEEIINALTRIEDLRVLARTSSFAFKGREEQVQEIGAQLGVGCLVEGSVRTVGDQVRITAQLIDCEHGYHLWSERYDREMSDVFAIQDEVARAIVETLKAKLGTGESIVRPGTANLEAYTLYLQGRYHWNRRTANELEKGIELFRKAIAIDDRYGLAWAGLADSYSILGWYRHLSSIEAYTKTVSAASSAVAVDDSLAEPHTSLAYARFMYGWDWTGAEEGFRAALERNPDYAVARHWFGEFLVAMGRFDEALEQLDIAHALDPLSSTIGFGVGWVRYFLGDYRAAIRSYEQTLEQDPEFVLAPWFLGPALVQAGEPDRAIDVCESWIPRVRRKNGLTALLAFAQARAGRRDDALSTLARLEKLPLGKEVAPDHLALVYIGLGDLDRAFECLNVALRQRSWYLVFLNVDPAFEPLRTDPRFGRLVSEVGLDDVPGPAPV
ncbi:MAG: tetratricopeptide repeat protein [marine benthic group bacterium]|nr:tetratricopeptide repeat protein [Gemmatimonadota bacterium]